MFYFMKLVHVHTMWNAIPCYMFYSLFNEMIFTIVYLIEAFLAIYFYFQDSVLVLFYISFTAIIADQGRLMCTDLSFKDEQVSSCVDHVLCTVLFDLYLIEAFPVCFRDVMHLDL